MQTGRLKVYKGNYSQYARQKEIEEKSHLAALAKQTEYIKKTEEYIRRNKAGIKSKQARGRQSQLDRLQRIASAPNAEGFGLQLPPPAACADKVLILEKLTAGYGTPLLQEISLTVWQGEKIAVIGNNGAGKTTLLKTLAGLIAPLRGRAKVGGRVKAGYFSQSHEGLAGAESILDNLVADYGLPSEKARTFLGGMLFRGDDVFKALHDLSGGERARLALLRMLLDGANLLLLDEPTNHLDASARLAVETALKQWPGTILLVSHDRYFIDQVAGRVWEIENGAVTDYSGNYSYYREQKAAQRAEQPLPPARPERAADKSAVVRKDKKERGTQKRLAAVELSLREQEVLLAVLAKRLSDPAEHADFAASRALSAEYVRQSAQVDRLTAEWEELLVAAAQEG
jgi:ATP-binding cassette subfamily F protein 3